MLELSKFNLKALLKRYLINIKKILSIFGQNKRPFIYQEVIDLGGEPIKNTDYTSLGRVTEFKYGKHLSDCVAKLSGQKISYLKNFGTGWGMIQDGDSLVFIDNHDNQRGHGKFNFCFCLNNVPEDPAFSTEGSPFFEC